MGHTDKANPVHQAAQAGGHLVSTPGPGRREMGLPRPEATAGPPAAPRHLHPRPRRCLPPAPPTPVKGAPPGSPGGAGWREGEGRPGPAAGHSSRERGGETAAREADPPRSRTAPEPPATGTVRGRPGLTLSRRAAAGTTSGRRSRLWSPCPEEIWAGGKGRDGKLRPARAAGPSAEEMADAHSLRGEGTASSAVGRPGCGRLAVGVALFFPSYCRGRDARPWSSHT